MLGRLLRDQEGMASVEYAVLLAVLVAAAWLMWRFFGYRMRRPVRRLVRRWPTAP
jgi:peptidoglycan/LPS O-acetylase OafA/YrhL